MTANRSVAFVLCGGGSLGAVQAGMLHELLGAGIRPDLIVGVSAGALNGAFVAYDPSVAMADRICQLWSQVTTKQALGLTWRTFLALLGMRGHLADTSGVRGILERELPYRTFDGARVALHVMAADEITGAEVLLNQGSVLEAVLASSAIPGVFAPVNIGGRALVDGAISSGTPIATAARLGAARLIILPCGFTCVAKAVPRHALGRAMHAIALLGARQLRRDYEEYAARVELRMVPPLCPMETASFDYSRGAELVAAARESTRRWLEQGGLERDGFPDEMKLHSHPA